MAILLFLFMPSAQPFNRQSLYSGASAWICAGCNLIRISVPQRNKYYRNPVFFTGALGLFPLFSDVIVGGDNPAIRYLFRSKILQTQAVADKTVASGWTRIRMRLVALGSFRGRDAKLFLHILTLYATNDRMSRADRRISSRPEARRKKRDRSGVAVPSHLIVMG